MTELGTGRGERMDRRAIIPVLLVLLLMLTPFGIAVPDEYEPTFGSASGRACGGPVATDSITILPPGPVTLPADQSLLFNATLYDSDGFELGGDATWGTDDGSIQPQGGGSAIYYPTTIGNHTVWACSASVNASVQVQVTIGAAQWIELVGNGDNVTTDEEIEFQVVQFDVHGNSAPLYVPSQYWTIPDGSSIVSASGQPARWTPGPLGNFIIVVSASGFSAQFEVNVSRGVGQDLVVTYSQSLITSDDTVALTMEISDAAGNTWAVEGDWSTLQPEAAEWLTTDGTDAVFDGHTIGNWTVRADYNGPENGFINMSDEVTIDVRVGRISLVIIDGHDTTILTGETLELNPVATDLDGNVVEGATFNWSVDGVSGDDSIDEEASTFTPSAKGQHTIFVESGGRPSSARVQVEWSEPVALNVTTTGGDWYLTVTTGESLPLHVLGLDVMGGWHSYDPVWQVEEAWGTIEEAGGDGDYLFHAAGVNWTQLHAFVGEDEYTVLVYVTPGQLDHLTVSIQDHGVQGESATFVVEGFDVSGNGVSIPICDVTIDSSAGRTECLDGQWTLMLDHDGEQQLVTASYDGSEGTAFIDVRPTLLEGQFGSSTQVIVVGAGLLGLMITMVLLFAYARVRQLAKEYDEEEEEEESEVTMTPGIIPSPVLGPPPPPSSIAGGVATMQGSPPPPSPAILGKMGKRRNKPVVAPPAFMFGQGLTSNSTGSAPQPGIFVRSDPKYGWGDPAKAPAEGYGWEGQTGPQSSAVIGATGFPTGAPPPPPGFSPGLQPAPQQNAPAPSDTSPASSALSDALSKFGSAEMEEKTEPEASSLDAALSKFGSPTEEDTVEPEESEVEVDESEEISEVSDEEVVSEEPESEEAEPDEVVWDDAEPELESDEPWDDGWDSEWGEPSAVKPGLGPQVDEGSVLKSLPGTKAGESGWYFDGEGKPSLWEFRPFGWERIE